MRFSEVIKEVIRLSEASRQYWEVELPKYHPHYPIVRTGELEAPAPPEDAQIQQLLSGLTQNELYSLLLLAYLGRGDFGSSSLATALHDLKDSFPRRDAAIAQLTASEALAEYLTDATDELQKRHIDLDELPDENQLQTN